MNKYPVYILSKGRAGNCMTAKLMESEGLDYYIFVEPQDYKAYAENFPKERIVKLPRNDQGIAYVRNAILKHSRRKGEFAHWQMDDDIRKFMVYKLDKKATASAGKNVGKKVPVKARSSVLKLEKKFDSYEDLGMIAHRYVSFAFAQKDPFSFNKNMCSSFLLRNDMKNCKWNKYTVEDADFALQVLYAGWTTLITNRELIDTMPPMKQSGGLTDSEYSGNGVYDRFVKLCEDWPGAFSAKYDSNGRPRLYHKRIWASFTQRPTPKKRKR